MISPELRLSAATKGLKMIVKKLFIPIAYLLCALVNLAPTVGVSSDARLEQLYATDIPGSDLSLLMRHRAILFGIVGILLLVAAIRKQLRTTAGLAGLVSMLSYIILFATSNVDNSNLLRIAWIDGVACVLLLIAMAMHIFGIDHAASSRD